MKYFLLSVLLLAGCGDNDPGLAKKVSLTKDQLAAIENRITPFSVVNVAGESAGSVAVNALPGEALYAACGACHGAQGGGGVGPALANKGVEYIVGRLNAYRAGETVGRQSNMMWGQAAGLSDTDINDLAEYIDTL